MLDKAVTKYRREGLVALLREGPQYLGYRLVRRGVLELLLRASVTSDELADRGKRWEYGSEQTVTISPPYTGRVPPEFEPVLGEQRSPRPFVSELSNARLVGPYAISQTAAGETVFEELGTEMNAFNRLRDTCETLGSVRTARELLTTRVSSDAPEYGRIINMVPRHGQSVEHVNYAHWFLENLPRLRALDQEAAADVTLLIRPDMPGWAMESLELLGFTPDDWTGWEGGISTVEELMVPRLPYIHSFGSQYDPAGRAWVRDRLMASVGPDVSPPVGPRVYISRQNQRRKVSNFEELMHTLTEFGFEPFRPEDHSMREVIRVYENAEFIVGPHGAGMADMIYADDATVVELFPKNEVRPVFYITANEFGHEYDFVVGENPPDVGYNPTRNKDILVDTSEVREIIQQGLARVSSGTTE